MSGEAIRQVAEARTPWSANPNGPDATFQYARQDSFVENPFIRNRGSSRVGPTMRNHRPPSPRIAPAYKSPISPGDEIRSSPKPRACIPGSRLEEPAMSWTDVHTIAIQKLIEMGPPDWHAYLGFPVADPSRVRAIDSNLSTVTAECDKVRSVRSKARIIHIEFQPVLSVW